jgi:hypothetical protein
LSFAHGQRCARPIDFDRNEVAPAPAGADARPEVRRPGRQFETGNSSKQMLKNDRLSIIDFLAD